MQISLGKCYYGDFDEAATATAVREDGSGWIAVCDEHREKAEKDGYVPGEPMDNLEPVTGEGADVPEGEREDEAGDTLDGDGDGDGGDDAEGQDAQGEESSLDEMMDDEDEKA